MAPDNDAATWRAFATKYWPAQYVIVARSPEPVAVSAADDGRAQAPVVIRESRLYTLFDGGAYGGHMLAIACRSQDSRRSPQLRLNERQPARRLFVHGISTWGVAAA